MTDNKWLWEDMPEGQNARLGVAQDVVKESKQRQAVRSIPAGWRYVKHGDEYTLSRLLNPSVQVPILTWWAALLSTAVDDADILRHILTKQDGKSVALRTFQVLENNYGSTGVTSSPVDTGAMMPFDAQRPVTTMEAVTQDLIKALDSITYTCIKEADIEEHTQMFVASTLKDAFPVTPLAARHVASVASSNDFRRAVVAWYCALKIIRTICSYVAQHEQRGVTDTDDILNKMAHEPRCVRTYDTGLVQDSISGLGGILGVDLLSKLPRDAGGMYVTWIKVACASISMLLPFTTMLLPWLGSPLHHAMMTYRMPESSSRDEAMHLCIAHEDDMSRYARIMADTGKCNHDTSSSTFEDVDLGNMFDAGGLLPASSAAFSSQEASAYSVLGVRVTAVKHAIASPIVTEPGLAWALGSTALMHTFLSVVRDVIVDESHVVPPSVFSDDMSAGLEGLPKYSASDENGKDGDQGFWNEAWDDLGRA